MICAVSGHGETSNGLSIVVLSMKAGLCMVESWEEGDGCAWYLEIGRAHV